MLLPDFAKPIARPAVLRWRKWRADRLARRPVAAERGESPDLPPPAFIFACGRSGTTILGKVFGVHPEVCYLREPYHLWAAIDPGLDVTNLLVRAPARLWWDSSDASDVIRARFARLILGARERSGRRVLIEKTPHNVYRLGLIEVLTGGRARFVHIVRDGVDVARSIERLAVNQPYRMAGRADYNQWWGSDGLKWRRLEVEGPARGHLTPGEVAQLASASQRGAYEWLTSLAEADRWRAVLEDRLLEVTYPQLTADPAATLTRIAEHVGASAPASWLGAVVPMITAERRNEGPPLELPPEMAREFNNFQERFGFPGRARALGGGGA